MRRTGNRTLALFLCAALLLGCVPACGESASGTMKMLVINVRKADCILLECGEDLYMVDTGSKESWGQVSRVLKTNGIDRLTGVILTHTDADHAGGLTALASSDIGIGAIYTSVFYTCKEKKHPAVLAAGRRGLEVQFLTAGDRLPFGDGSLKVLGPVEESDVENNCSVVLLAQGGGGSILLAGDMETPEEESLAREGLIEKADVLKVANHGESDATGGDFVAAVSPRLAVISTNTADEPDTPSTRVLRELMNVGAEVLQTQNAKEGVLVTFEDGKMTAGYTDGASVPDKNATLKVTGKDLDNDAVTIENTGAEEVDLSGWFIFSERGGETFVFPNGSRIAAGQTVTVTSLSSREKGDYVWQDKKIWHQSKSDCAILYDVYGRIVSYTYE